MCGVTVHYEDVLAADQRVRSAVRRTPLVYNRRNGAWFKLEQFQKTGAYKVRGALNALLCQIERNDRRPVIAASAGNHGAGVAWAARHVGLRAVIVVPINAPRVKVDTIRSLGAHVVLFGENFDQSLKWARSCARRRGWRFLHAFDDPDVIAGQGTVALELLALEPDAVAVPIGGGGLASGMSLVLHQAGIPVVGVQVAGVDAMASHLGGGPARIVPRPTVADGLRVREPGTITRNICRSHLSGVVRVSEPDVVAAMRSMESEEGWRVEGAGAVTCAALPQIPGRRRVALVTGGNRDELADNALGEMIAK